MNEEKDKLQKEAVTLFEGNRNILLSWATGAGKTAGALQCILNYANIDPLSANSVRCPKVLIVVAEELHKDNWRDEFIKWNLAFLLGNTIIDCYASLPKHIGKIYDLILFDEAHHISEFKAELLQSITWDKCIMLSATLAPDIAARIKESVGEYAEMHISLDEAIERGILPKPKIYKVGVTLDDKFKKHHTTFGKKKVILTDKGMYKKLAGQMDRWQDMKRRLEEEGKSAGWIERKMITLGGIRKAFLASCKTEEARKLLISLSGKRMICFTGSTEQCEELGGINSLNSSRGTKHNKLTLKKFNDKEINELYVNKMVKEGQNLTDIEVGVIVQLDSGKDDGLSFLQRCGRILRAENPEIYILYCENTTDDKYLNRALNKIDEKFIIN